MHRKPISEVEIGGTTHKLATLVPTFISFGESTFGDFCNAIATDFP